MSEGGIVDHVRNCVQASENIWPKRLSNKIFGLSTALKRRDLEKKLRVAGKKLQIRFSFRPRSPILCLFMTIRVPLVMSHLFKIISLIMVTWLLSCPPRKAEITLLHAVLKKNLSEI